METQYGNNFFFYDVYLKSPILGSDFVIMGCIIWWVLLIISLNNVWSDLNN